MRSLPNIIKSDRIVVTKNNIKIIDSNPSDEFATLSFKEAIEIDSESKDVDENEDELFQMNHKKNNTNHLNEMKAYADSLVEDAKREADRIKVEAIEEAKVAAESIRAVAKEEGYQEGISLGQQRIQDRLEELDQKEIEQNLQFDHKLEEMQAQMTELLIAYVRKITGIVIEEKQIIMYLVKNAVKSNSTCNEFRISVSKLDYEEVLCNIDEIKELTRSTAQITIVENPELMKNQCKIETDKNVIDCSIETKLENLIMALKLLT